MEFIEQLKALEQNWDGYGASQINRNAIDNLLSFADKYKVRLCADNVSPTTYGTVTLEFQNLNADLVSLEFGKTMIGFFTDFRDGFNFEIDRILFDINNLPDKLIKSLKKIGHTF